MIAITHSHEPFTEPELKRDTGFNHGLFFFKGMIKPNFRELLYKLIYWISKSQLNLNNFFFFRSSTSVEKKGRQLFENRS